MITASITILLKSIFMECTENVIANGYSEHRLYEPEQNTLLWRTFTVTLSTLLEKGDFNRDRDRIQTPGFFSSN